MCFGDVECRDVVGDAECEVGGGVGCVAYVSVLLLGSEEWELMVR